MTESVDQVERILQKIVSRLIENYRPEQIILYGSMAYGSPDEDSDIDLLIIKETNDSPLQRRLQVRQIAADPQRKIPFSPLVLTRKELENRLKLGDPFYDEILRHGKVLYAQ
jgi:predicted nucleotidyltransferase